MRVVIDTNVWLSGLLWRGAPHELIQRARAGAVNFIISPTLLLELASVIGRPKFDTILARSGTSGERLLAEVRQLVELIDPPPLTAPVCRDPDDDAALALGLAAQADLIVSGDDDLLSLGSYRGIQIVAAGMAVERVDAE